MLPMVHQREAWCLELSQPRPAELRAFRLTLSLGAGLGSHKGFLYLHIYIYMFCFLHTK